MMSTMTSSFLYAHCMTADENLKLIVDSGKNNDQNVGIQVNRVSNDDIDSILIAVF